MHHRSDGHGAVHGGIEQSATGALEGKGDEIVGRVVGGEDGRHLHPYVDTSRVERAGEDRLVRLQYPESGSVVGCVLVHIEHGR